MGSKFLQSDCLQLSLLLILTLTNSNRYPCCKQTFDKLTKELHLCKNCPKKTEGKGCVDGEGTKG